MEFQERCPNCGAERVEGAVYCGNCGKPFEDKKPEPDKGPGDEKPERSKEPIKPVFPQEPPPSDDERKYVAWEDRENRGFFEALWETWKESVFYPEKFFAKLPFRGGIGNPLLYAVIVGWIGIGVNQLYGLFWTGAWGGFLSQFAEFEDLIYQTGIQSILSFIQIIFTPIFIIIGLFIISGIYHLIFLIFGWSKRDFEATFRALAYAEGATVFLIVPFCGWLISLGWAIVLSIIGLKHMQKTTGGKAAFVYFLPLIFCFCCCMGFIIVMLAVGINVGEFLFESMENEMYNWIAHNFIIR
ncbi:MAG: YIP1 family protein [Candidatus Zixiibacteriota bacterium]|nr:MAG: YIP1 family protein [candidate division Zixibacteria bacterium]